jgi:hypothetical protein
MERHGVFSHSAALLACLLRHRSSSMLRALPSVVQAARGMLQALVAWSRALSLSGNWHWGGRQQAALAHCASELARCGFSRFRLTIPPTPRNTCVFALPQARPLLTTLLWQACSTASFSLSLSHSPSPLPSRRVYEALSSSLEKHRISKYCMHMVGDYISIAATGMPAWVAAAQQGGGEPGGGMGGVVKGGELPAAAAIALRLGAYSLLAW